MDFTIKGTTVKFDRTDFDGVHFKHKVENEWDVLIVDFKDRANVKYDISEELNFYKYLILLFEPIPGSELESDRQAVYYQAYLGDPIKFITNHMKAGSSGFVIRKSKKAFEVLGEGIYKMEAKHADLIGKFYADMKEFLETRH